MRACNLISLFIILSEFNQLLAGDSKYGSQRVEYTTRSLEKLIQPGGIIPIAELDASILSPSWSGYVAQTNFAHPQNTVTAVSALWTVPLFHTSANGGIYAPWVGIDGYSSCTVQQTGTAFEWVDGAPAHFAWYEMFPLSAVEIVGFPLNPGDLIYASVSYLGSNMYDIVLDNVTRGVYYTTIQPGTIHPYCPGGPQNNSAEWILEVPGGGSYPLPNYGTMILSECTATINGVSGSITNNTWQNVSIDMVTNTAARILRASTSETFGSGTKFMSTWKHD